MNFINTLRHLITCILICCCWYHTVQPGAVRGGREYERKQREKIRAYNKLENELSKFADILDKAENEALKNRPSAVTAVQAAQAAWQQVQNAITALKQTGLNPTADQQSRIDNLENRLEILEAYVAEKVSPPPPPRKPSMSGERVRSEVTKDTAAEDAARAAAVKALNELEEQIKVIKAAVKNLPKKPTSQDLAKITDLMPGDMLVIPEKAVKALGNFPDIDASPYHQRLDALIKRGRDVSDQLGEVNKKILAQAPLNVRQRQRTLSLSKVLAKNPFATYRRATLPARLTGEARVFEPVVVEEEQPGPKIVAPVPARQAAASRSRSSITSRGSFEEDVISEEEKEEKQQPRPSRVSTPQELTTEQKNLQRIKQRKLPKKGVTTQEPGEKTYAGLLGQIEKKIVQIKQALNEYSDNQQPLDRYNLLKNLSKQIDTIQEEIKTLSYLRRLIRQQFVAIEQQPQLLRKQIEDYYREEFRLIDTDIALVNSRITQCATAGDIERARLTHEINSLLEKLDQELNALPPEKVKQQQENLETLRNNFKEAQKQQPGLFAKIKAALWGSEKLPKQPTPQNVEDVLQLQIDSIAQSTPVADMEATARSFATGIRMIKDDKKRAELLSNFVKNVIRLGAGKEDQAIRGRVQAAFFEAEDDAKIRELVQPYFSDEKPLPPSFRPQPLVSVEEESEEEEEDAPKPPAQAPQRKASISKKTSPQKIQPAQGPEPQKIVQPHPKEPANIVAAKAKLEELAVAIERRKKQVIKAVIDFPATFDAQKFTTYKSALDKATADSTKYWAAIQELVAQNPDLASSEESEADQEPKFTMEKFIVLQRQAEQDTDFIANLDFYLNPDSSAIMSTDKRIMLLHTVFETLDKKDSEIKTIGTSVKQGSEAIAANSKARKFLKSIQSIITKNKRDIPERLLTDFYRQAQYEISRIEKFIVASTPEKEAAIEEKEFELKIPEKKPSPELRSTFTQRVNELLTITTPSGRHDKIAKFLEETAGQKDELLVLVEPLTKSQNPKRKEIGWDLWLEIDLTNRIRGWENWGKEIAPLTQKITALDKEITQLKEAGTNTEDKEKERNALELERGEAIEQRDNLMLTKFGVGSFLETLEILKSDNDITQKQKDYFMSRMNTFIRSKPRTQPASQIKPQAQVGTLPLPKAPASSSEQAKIVTGKILEYCKGKSDALWAEIETLLSTASPELQKQAHTTHDLVQQIDQYKKAGKPEASTLDEKISTLTVMPNVQTFLNDLLLEAQITQEGASGESDAGKKMQDFLDQISNQPIIKRVIKNFGEKFKLEEAAESTGSLKVRKGKPDLPSTSTGKSTPSGTMQISTGRARGLTEVVEAQ
ncbi:MAG: hypothetical protein WC365_04375 [Candidatus Babeliales bacterium]|jgi:hypothetical protein